MPRSCGYDRTYKAYELSLHLWLSVQGPWNCQKEDVVNLGFRNPQHLFQFW